MKKQTKIKDRIQSRRREKVGISSTFDKMKCVREHEAASWIKKLKFRKLKIEGECECMCAVL